MVGVVGSSPIAPTKFGREIKHLAATSGAFFLVVPKNTKSRMEDRRSRAIKPAQRAVAAVCLCCRHHCGRANRRDNGAGGGREGPRRVRSARAGRSGGKCRRG